MYNFNNCTDNNSHHVAKCFNEIRLSAQFHQSSLNAMSWNKDDPIIHGFKHMNTGHLTQHIIIELNIHKLAICNYNLHV